MIDDSPFGSPAQFDRQFIEGLERQLEAGVLGAFILALANATFEQRLWTHLRGRITDQWARLADGLRQVLQSGGRLDASDDDQLVFLKLLAIGLDQLPLTRFQRLGPWEAQYNLLRGLRPPRMADQAVSGVSAPFEPHCFNFALPHLARELFWQGSLDGRETRFFYNKFPFVTGHLLMVPEADARHPQLLNREMLEFVWRFLDAAGRTLPGIGAGYNSYGALASVNHLHFQIFRRGDALPVEAASWQHHGGATPYPAVVQLARSAQEAWRILEGAHAAGQAYNLVLRPGVAHILPRRLQGTYERAPWSAGHAWYEMAGGAVVTSRRTFERLEGSALSDELAKLGGGIAGRAPPL